MLRSLYNWSRHLEAQGRILRTSEEWAGFGFLVEVSPDGEFCDLLDVRRAPRGGKGKRLPSEPQIVPRKVQRSGKTPKANLLWDNISFALGLPSGKTTAAKAAEYHARFRAVLDGLPDALRQDAGVAAVIRFLAGSGMDDLRSHSAFEDLAKTGYDVTFRLRGDNIVVPSRSAVLAHAAASALLDDALPPAPCLVTGRDDLPIARIHRNMTIPGNGIQRASLVNFTLQTAQSYGLEQGSNAPVSVEAMAGYVAALEYAFSWEGRRHRITIGDTSIVFWGCPTLEDTLHGAARGYVPKPETKSVGEGWVGDDPWDPTVLRSALLAHTRGALPDVGEDSRFYILALSPNRARVAVRGWQEMSISEASAGVLGWIERITIIGPDGSRPLVPTMRSLLGAVTVPRSKPDDEEQIPPRLPAELMRSIISGAPLPRTLVMMAIQRAKAERRTTPERAAIARAWLCERLANDTYDEVPMSLDPTITHPGYLLGRLLAVMEGAQYAAVGKVGSTIRDRYYASAKTTPTLAFSQIDAINKKHMAKLRRDKPSAHSRIAKEIDNIMDLLGTIPRKLDLEGQAQFMLGYHHQSAEAQRAIEAAKIKRAQPKETEASASESEENTVD